MTGPQLRQISPGVHAWIGVGGDSNAGAVETRHGLVVVDTQQSHALGQAFRNALHAAVPGPLRAVINTHFHLDHIAGNTAFRDVPIIAHERTLQALERELGALPADGATVDDTLRKIRMFFGGNFAELVPDCERGWFVERVGGAAPLTLQPPSQGFADRLELRLAADVLRVEYWGPAHCDGDVIIRLDKAGVIFLGDLFFHGRFPWLGDCDLDGWIACLERVLQMDVTIVVPGHGEPTSLAEVARFRGLLVDVRSAVAQAVKAGASEEAAVAEIALPAYAAMPRYREWMPFNVCSAYRCLRGR
jgi:glyoxylase-like metal-dependent hydrolase (beta-lactamase superfamily II)